MALENSLTERSNFFIIQAPDSGCGMNNEIRPRVVPSFASTKRVRGASLGRWVPLSAHDRELPVEFAPARGAQSTASFR
jgi:hypothetical protein